MGLCVCSCFVVYCFIVFAFILIGKRYAVALPCLSSWCLVSAIALWLFLVVPWVDLHGVIEVFPDHTHLLFILNDQCGSYLY